VQYFLTVLYGDTLRGKFTPQINPFNDGWPHFIGLIGKGKEKERKREDH
jgi:hypothetical protein